jgi:hypothetical protein
MDRPRAASRNRWPRWTAPAFDRCLLLALIYPIVTVFAVWALSGHVGPAERALGLRPDDPASRYPDLWRGLSFFSAAGSEQVDFGSHARRQGGARA